MSEELEGSKGSEAEFDAIQLRSATPFVHLGLPAAWDLAKEANQPHLAAAIATTFIIGSLHFMKLPPLPLQVRSTAPPDCLLMRADAVPSGTGSTQSRLVKGPRLYGGSLGQVIGAG